MASASLRLVWSRPASLTALAALAALAPLSLTGCPVGPEGTVGSAGIVVFQERTGLVFENILVAGSVFDVVGAPNGADFEDDIAGAVFDSADGAALVVEVNTLGAGRVRVVDPGTHTLRVVDPDGQVVDSIELRAAVPGVTELVDSATLLATDTLDARAPASFALLAGRATSLLVSAVDRCGGDLLDLGASVVTSENPDVGIVFDDASNAWVVTGAVGDMDLSLETPGLLPLTYSVEGVEGDDVDEVSVAVAAIESTSARLWGRAFSNDAEVLGLDFDWSADARVTLNAQSGLVVDAVVSFPLEGEEPDTRPASVTASALGESGSIDLLGSGVQVTDRGPPPQRSVGADDNDDEPAAEAGGCGGGTACDPLAALLVLAWPLRRLRRLAGLSQSSGSSKRP